MRRNAIRITEETIFCVYIFFSNSQFQNQVHWLFKQVWRLRRVFVKFEFTRLNDWNDEIELNTALTIICADTVRWCWGRSSKRILFPSLTASYTHAFSVYSTPVSVSYQLVSILVILSIITWWNKIQFNCQIIGFSITEKLPNFTDFIQNVGNESHVNEWSTTTTCLMCPGRDVQQACVEAVYMRRHTVNVTRK